MRKKGEAIIRPNRHVVREEAWLEFARCRGLDPELFFPHKGENMKNNPAARALCAECPVREPCLDYAVDNGVRDGTWGGHTAKEIQRIRAARRRGAA